ncbi:hypothetical protein B0H67DRAFT_229613 [Lasiosphaeris hirsuta]|uniref:Uncharacterized protein n=1 Tax=Lasiosphaeris hirsuta TaxID=260670 RepID=A0AA40DVQ3_9PEZI|nr:hypothetical protein B0H67DRAFT_229613 [Lasiosphaeris hirsuta]
MWNQGNAKINTLATKLRDKELKEQGLVRKCNDLRAALAYKNNELTRSRDLYKKLKQKVLLGQSPGAAPRGMLSNAAVEVDIPGSRDRFSGSGMYEQQPHIPNRVLPVGSRDTVPNYFPSPDYPNPQASSASTVGWSKSMASHVSRTGTPATHIPVGAGASGPMTASRSDVRPAGAVPSASRLLQPLSSRTHSVDKQGRFSRASLNEDRIATRVPGDQGGFSSSAGRAEHLFPIDHAPRF